VQFQLSGSSLADKVCIVCKNTSGTLQAFISSIVCVCGPQDKQLLSLKYDVHAFFSRQFVMPTKHVVQANQYHSFRQVSKAGFAGMLLKPVDLCITCVHADSRSWSLGCHSLSTGHFAAVTRHEDDV